MTTALSFQLTPAVAKTPGHTHCYGTVCHRVKTIEETARLIGVKTVLHASHYDACGRDRYNPCGLTSSGEAFDPNKPDNAASPIYPDGTKLLVWHPSTKKALVLRVNNAGPYWGKRNLDVSRGAARILGFSGIATLFAKVLAAPTVQEARYRRNRRYPPVPGFIGTFENIELAAERSFTQLALQLASPIEATPLAKEPASSSSKGKHPAAAVQVAAVIAPDPKQAVPHEAASQPASDQAPAPVASATPTPEPAAVSGPASSPATVPGPALAEVSAPVEPAVTITAEPRAVALLVETLPAVVAEATQAEPVSVISPAMPPVMASMTDRSEGAAAAPVVKSNPMIVKASAKPRTRPAHARTRIARAERPERAVLTRRRMPRDADSDDDQAPFGELGVGAGILAGVRRRMPPKGRAA